MSTTTEGTAAKPSKPTVETQVASGSTILRALTKKVGTETETSSLDINRTSGGNLLIIVMNQTTGDKATTQLTREAAQKLAAWLAADANH